MWMNRRRRVAAVAAVALAFGSALTGCAGTTPGDSGGELTVIGYKDPTGNLQQILDAWNTSHPKAKAHYVALPTDADAQHQLLAQYFLARTSTNDVVIADDTWTAEFAAKRWLVPLPSTVIPASKLVTSVVQGGVFDGKVYSVPFTASAQFLYYRKDLVAKPPTSWAQLIADCKIAKAHHMGCYAGQYAQYEGLVVNFVSAIASAGGRILNSDGAIDVDSPQALAGLQFLTNGFRQGYIPKAAITYQEQQNEQAFEQGQLLFATNYSFVYQEANTKGPGTKVAGKVGIAPIPGRSGPGVVATGGHMMGVSAYSKHRTDATAFVKYFTSESNARQLLLKLGYAPAWKSLYSDPALVKKFPYLSVINEELQHAVVRPRVRDYIALSLVIQKNVYAALQGGKSAKAALQDMSAQMKDVIDDN